MASNKVKYGLRNVHYSLYDSTLDSYGQVKSIDGGVNLSLSPQGESYTFYADNVAFYTTQADQGYSGDLEIATIPDQMKKDVWGWTEDANHVLVEDNQASVKPFALLFQVNGDAFNRYCVLYNCSAARPNINAATIGEQAEPQTDTISLTVMPRADGKVQAVTLDSTATSVLTTWFTTVYTG